MATKSETPLQNLTVFLLREGINNADKALRDPGSLKYLEIRSDDQKLGDLYIQNPKSHPPSWGKFFDGYINLSEFGRVSTAAAVLFMPTQSRVFAVIFGHGRHLIEPGSYEERFGLRVVLNSIDEQSLRSIDKKTLDAISTHTRVQSTIEAGATDFGLDVEQDLLRAVTGRPKREIHGTRLSGMDSLHAAVRVELGDLNELLDNYLELFNDDSYRSSFPWVDHIAEVSNQGTIASLDELLVQGLKAESLKRCWLAVPEIIEWTNIKGFRYKPGSREPQYPDLHLPDFIRTIEDRDQLTPDFLRKRFATSIDLSDYPIHRWSVYQCLYCEIEHNGDSYLITSGKWYRVSRDFVESINGFFMTLPRFPESLPEYKDAAECTYCERVAAERPHKFALMDRKIIPIGGAYSKIEFCDLFSKDRDIIHIKRYAASSVMSHLFSQGVVSGEAFRSDQAFREAVNAHLPPGFQISTPECMPDSSAYRIVFAVVSDEPADLTLPFFSKVNLKHAATRLQAYGYRTALAKIQVDDRTAKTKKYKAR